MHNLNDSPQKQKDSEDFRRQQRQKEITLNLMHIQKQDTQESVKMILSSHHQNVQQIHKIVQQDIFDQKSNILKRLEERRQSKVPGLNKSTYQVRKSLTPGKDRWSKDKSMDGAHVNYSVDYVAQDDNDESGSSSATDSKPDHEGNR